MSGMPRARCDFTIVQPGRRQCSQTPYAFFAPDETRGVGDVVCVGCPYTQKHYNSGNMQQLQRVWTSRGVIWLTVISSTPGKQGYATRPDENAVLTGCL